MTNSTEVHEVFGTPMAIQEINDNIDNLLEQSELSNWCFVSTIDPNRYLLVSIVDQSKTLLQNIEITANCKYIETESLQYLLVTYDQSTDTLYTQDVSELLLYQLNVDASRLGSEYSETGLLSRMNSNPIDILTQFLHEKWVLKNDRN